MNRSLAYILSLSILALAVPLRAETVYIPVLEPVDAAGAPLATHLWISDAGEIERSGSVVSGTGLLAIAGTPELPVNAWVESGSGRNVHYAGLPVISSRTRIAAGGAIYLNGVGRDGDRDVTLLALIDLGETASQCRVDVVAEDGSRLYTAGSVEVPAKSMRRFDDALGLRGAPAATVRVSCDQPFYALAARVDGATSEVSFVLPSAVIAKEPKPAAPAGGVITFDQAGVFHRATRENAKKILRVPVPQALNATKILIEFDVVAGPWNPRLSRGAHNLIFIHRGRFRSDTLANINAFGPGNNDTKAAQNIDMPAKQSTFVRFPFVFRKGQTYHISQLYDAARKVVTYGIYQKGRLLKGGQYEGTAHSRLIAVPATGLVAEFGNYNDQFLPEVSSLGWTYANFHVEIVRSSN
jgi:hypothetical protein